MRATDDEFAEFAAASARLRRVAFMLCGDWHSRGEVTPVDTATGVAGRPVGVGSGVGAVVVAP